MKKIPTVFMRNPDNIKELTREVNPICQWVIDGEGVPTRKYNGTCVMRDESGGWWARREVKPGQTEPVEFKLMDTDEITGKKFGVIPIENSDFYKFWQETISSGLDRPCLEWTPGTYELCGPKINKNPEGYGEHVLIRHAEAEVLENFNGAPRDYDTIKAIVLGVESSRGWEGMVFHHPDGRMAKIKGRDYKFEAQ